MNDISEDLKKRLSHYGLLKQAEAARICALACEIGSKEFTAVSFRDGVIKLRVDSNAKAYLLKMRKDEILKSINDAFGRKVVTELCFRVGKPANREG